MARNVNVNEDLAKNHTQLLKLRAFYNTNQLKICESIKEHETARTHLIIGNYKVSEMLQKHYR